MLDLIDYATNPQNLDHLGHLGQTPEVHITDSLSEQELKSVFRQGTSGAFTGGDHWRFGSRWIERPFTWKLEAGGNNTFIAIDPPFDRVSMETYEQNLARVKQNPFSGLSFKRLVADRDISPEEDWNDQHMESNGQGVTNAIQHFINKSWLPSKLVEETLLGDLNYIFELDGHFTDIVVQQLDSGRWELYLEEPVKGRVSLTHTGSGFKTVLLVLAFIHLIPHIENTALDKYLFGFEELENNLHPALQRRLLMYLRKIALEKGCRFFLTTHSNVAIDLFSSDKDAQILHVTHNGNQSFSRPVATYVENKGVLDDLDVRASDLLQSNGVVWVEGPSDRLYFNRWIEIFSDGEIQEGTHYQCVFYGGRLLAHLSAKDPDVDTEELVKVLRVNGNVIVLMDSDRRKPRQRINATKKRIRDEIENVGGMAWVTRGKEIENYIPAESLRDLYSQTGNRSLDQFENMSEYLDKIQPGSGKRFLHNKVLFAEQVCPHLNRENLAGILDLQNQVEAVCRLITEWNGGSLISSPRMK